MELTSREQFIVKIFSMLDNKELMEKLGNPTPTPEELLQFMDMLRISQYPRISFDTMIDMIGDYDKIADQMIETSKFIIKQMKKI